MIHGNKRIPEKNPIENLELIGEKPEASNHTDDSNEELQVKLFVEKGIIRAIP